MTSESRNENLKSLVERELKLGHQARKKGNEGRARVCARRAAGWAIQSIYSPGPGEPYPEGNAYRFLLWFKDEGRFPPSLREAAERLTARVDEDFSLPFDEDPLDDSALIVDWILALDD